MSGKGGFLSEMGYVLGLQFLHNLGKVNFIAASGTTHSSRVDALWLEICLLQTEILYLPMENLDRLREFFTAKNLKSYHPLMSEKELAKWLKPLDPNQFFSVRSKTDFLKQLNSFALTHLEDELFLKHLLTKAFFEENIVGAFEVRALSSRLDLLKINGVTTAFEIKSDFDSLEKLEKQSQDYLALFEYNYLVVGEKHLDKALKLLPSDFGIYIVKNKKLKRFRSSRRNKTIDPKSQLSTLTSKELRGEFKSTESNWILANFSSIEVNEAFKKILKKRYAKKWNFIKERSSEIFPLDYQYFFHHPINPQLIYSR
ncbi:sce7726 family protein [Algoriphagus sp. CAU 1675]|uniref:sce7726 family protein n=1 Tax=Algoriphagus sp. CAU 1675 TaxID=3032597 RepID=UPI0023DC74EF|nr:sce7726 family protein [Algoriphagus sp. CAU 1675]MDF2159389.1 sce7726 family protein [Algoriphagus sp. CAU 1675]